MSSVFEMSPSPIAWVEERQVISENCARPHQTATWMNCRGIHLGLRKSSTPNCFVALLISMTDTFTFPASRTRSTWRQPAESVPQLQPRLCFAQVSDVEIRSHEFDPAINGREVELVGSQSPSLLAVSSQTPTATIGVLVVPLPTANAYDIRILEFLKLLGGVHIALAIERRAPKTLPQTSEMFRLRFSLQSAPRRG